MITKLEIKVGSEEVMKLRWTIEIKVGSEEVMKLSLLQTNSNSNSKNYTLYHVLRLILSCKHIQKYLNS
jgi:hypothetical protein